MPELPEVETVMRGLAPTLIGQAITDVIMGEKGLRIPFPDGLKSRLKSAKIDKLTRRAKYILVHLSTENILAIHLGMSGRMRILAPGSNTPPEKHDHFKLILTNGHQIILNDARRFGMVFDVMQDEIPNHKAFRHLGPEPLGAEFTADNLHTRLKNKSLSIKVAIMDQRLVVGVGNIYACEALFRARLSPLRAAQTLSFAECQALVTNVRNVLEAAIAAGGSTLKDHRLPEGDFGYFQQSLEVYGRVGKPCPLCRRAVMRVVQGGRSTFYCETCQG